MPASHRASAVPAGNPTTSATITVPAGAVAGDLLFLAVTSRDSTGAGTLGVTDNDTGGNAWSKIGNTTDHKATLWYKRATSGTASKTVSVNNAVGSCAAVLSVIQGAYASEPPYLNVTPETNNSGDETAAGITPTHPNSLIAFAVYNYANDNAVTVLASANLGTLEPEWGEKLSTGGNDCACIMTGAQQAGGPSPTGNFTWTQTDGNGYSIAFEIRSPIGGGRPIGGHLINRGITAGRLVA